MGLLSAWRILIGAQHKVYDLHLEHCRAKIGYLCKHDRAWELLEHAAYYVSVYYGRD